jgi:YfiH family protein
MQRIEQDSRVYYQFDRLRRFARLSHGIFTRRGGVSGPPFESLNVGSTVGDAQANVLENRQRLARTLGVRDEDIHTVWQVHGADVLVLRGADNRWPPPQADALVTERVDLPISMRFADCVPLLFYDPVKKVLGMAHAGWRGTAAGVGPSTVKTMRDAFGCRPADIVAGIGPSIGPARYEVGPEVAAAIGAAFGDVEGLLFHPNGGSDRLHLDLWEANRRALQMAGVRQIEVAELCTASNVDEFYSHRAEGGRTGRFGVLAVLRGATDY